MNRDSLIIPIQEGEPDGSRSKKANHNYTQVAGTPSANDLMVSGMMNGIVRNGIVAFGGSGEVYDQFTATPFTPEAKWTGAEKIDTSKEGLIDRAQEYAFEQLLIANGMDGDLASAVSSTTNKKRKAKKARKEERTTAIESTAQTAVAIAAIAVTAGGATPALGSVLTGGASSTFYAVQGTSIALQAAIGSRKGGAQGAAAGLMNGVLQSLASTNLGELAKGADKLTGMADEIQTMAMNNPLLVKTLAATNISYDKENGWGIKANVTGVVNALGAPKTVWNNIAKNFTNVTIGQSQHGGATVNFGFNTPIGNMGLTYTGATGDFEGSYDFKEADYDGIKLSSEINIGKDGLSVSGNADFGNGYGLGIENGKSGVSSSLTILGSQQGSVDRYGNYTPNENFLGEISGQDIQDLIKSQQNRNEAADAENPDDKKKGPEGLVDLAFMAGAFLMTAGAALVAGGGSTTPSAPTSQTAGNSGNATTAARRPEDELPIGHDNDDPSKGLTRNELSEYNTLQDKLRNGEDLSPADAERHAQLAAIRNIQVNANSLVTTDNGGNVRDTDSEIRRARENATAENETTSRGVTDDNVDLVDNILGLAGWAAINTPLKRPVRPEEDLLGLNKAREANESKLRELQKSLNDLDSESNIYHLSSDRASSIESRRNLITSEMNRIQLAQNNISKDITRINSHLSELAARRQKDVPDGFQIANGHDEVDSKGNIKRITVFENPNLAEERGSRVITQVTETRDLSTGDIKYVENYQREIRLDNGVFAPVANSNGGITLNDPFGLRYNSNSMQHDGIDLHGSGSFTSPVPIQNVTITGGGAVRLDEHGRSRGIWAENGELWTYHQPDPNSNTVERIPYTREMAVAENRNYDSLRSSQGTGNMVRGAYEANGIRYTLSFMHLESVSGIKPGQTIGSGQSVGQVGSTGNSTGLHGHFQVQSTALPDGIDSQYYRALGENGQGPYLIDPIYFLNQIAGPNERSLHCDDK